MEQDKSDGTEPDQGREHDESGQSHGNVRDNQDEQSNADYDRKHEDYPSDSGSRKDTEVLIAPDGWENPWDNKKT